MRLTEKSVHGRGYAAKSGLYPIADLPTLEKFAREHPEERSEE